MKRPGGGLRLNASRSGANENSSHDKGGMIDLKRLKWALR
jgi:hypothetical protein